MLEPGSREVLEQNTREMKHAAHSGGTCGCLVRIGFQPHNQFLQIVCWQGFPCNNYEVVACDPGYRFEIFHHIVRECVDGTVQNVRGCVDTHERVAAA